MQLDRKRLAREHPARYIALFTVLGVVVALAWVFGFDKAWAICPVNNPDGSCATTTDMANKFTADKIAHVSGFDTSAMFADPADARAVFEAKIAHKFSNMSPTKQYFVRMMIGATNRSPSSAFTCDTACVAQREYNIAINKSSCVGTDLFTVIYGVCVPNNHHPFTRVGVRNAGSIFFCGGLAGIALAGAAESGGGTGYLAAFMGAGSCGWATYFAVTN